MNMARLLCVNVVGALVVGAALAFQPSALQLQSRCPKVPLAAHVFSNLARITQAVCDPGLRPLQTESMG